LRIKRFFGTSDNAVSTYVLVAIIRKQLNLSLSLHTMLQILSVTPFERQSLLRLLKGAEAMESTENSANQLNLLCVVVPTNDGRLLPLADDATFLAHIRDGSLDLMTRTPLLGLALQIPNAARAEHLRSDVGVCGGFESDPCGVT
jgi:hypothetical protein